MKRGYFSLIILTLLSSICLKAQQLKIEYEQGFGSYTMNNLKDINQVVQKELPFNTEIVSDFPMYWYFRPGIFLKYEKFEIGTIYSFYSTGSRISAFDYSGNYNFDIKIHSHSPGIKIKYFSNNRLKVNKISYSFSAILGANFSNLELDEYFSFIDTTLTNSNFKAKSFSYYFEPGVNLNYKVWQIDLGLNISYCIHINKQAFYIENNKNQILQNPATLKPLHPDWSGVRFGLSIGYVFNG